MSQPETTITPAQREKENAVFWAILLDQAVITYMVFVGIFSGSMTFISECIRCVLLVTIEYVSYFVLRRSHRGRFLEYEFGTGKIERIVNLVVAFSLCLACFFIFEKLISAGEKAPMSPSMLVLAVIGADINLIINVYFTVAFIRVNQTESSVIVASQIKSRLAKTVASLIVVLVLMVALWLPDPKSARIVDTAGSIFVMCYMLIIAYGLIKESLPEILDRTVPEPEHYQILRVLTQYIDQYDGFTGYRTRRSGKDLFVLLNLCFYPDTTLEEIERRLSPIRRTLESELPGSRVTIMPEILEPSCRTSEGSP